MPETPENTETPQDLMKRLVIECLKDAEVRRDIEAVLASDTVPPAGEQEDSEPLRCPWCGGPGNIRFRPVDGRSPTKGYQYYVECTNALTTSCNIIAKGKLRDSKKRAIADWNSRTPSVSPYGDEPRDR